MFTGLVSATGTLSGGLAQGEVARAWVQAPPGFADGLEPGGSVAVDGVCLTLVESQCDASADRLAFDLVPETLRLSNLGWRLEQGEEQRRRYGVNLERCLRLGDELGGHIVSGHVGAVARVQGVQALEGGACDMRLELAAEDAAAIFPKGFVAVNGVSLTVGEVRRGDAVAVVDFHLIPETLARTNLGQLRLGDPVNIEHDAMTVAVVQRLEQLGLAGQLRS